MNELNKIIGNWIQIIDDQNIKSIEDYSYHTGIIEESSKNHCVKCVAVNKCWFKNEIGKKPETFNYSNINIVDNLTKGILPGLYHPRCHCKESMIFPSSYNDIQLIIPNGKIDWLFKDKSNWIISMGYEPNNKFITSLYEQIKQSYFYGKYAIQTHNNFGVKIRINIDLHGQNDKRNKIYNLISSFTIFPNGKLKCNTLIGGWQK